MRFLDIKRGEIISTCFLDKLADIIKYKIDKNFVDSYSKIN